MEPATISAIATGAWTALQPYLPLIASKAAEKIGSALPEAVDRLWGAIKAKFESKPAAEEALTDVVRDPEDPDLQAAFRVQLRKSLEEDSAFAEQVKGLVEEAGGRIDVRVRDGAAAIGDQAKAVGKGGIMIEGGVHGDFHASDAEKTEK